MAEPRRALAPVPRRGRTVLLIAIPLAALLIVGGVALAQLQRRDDPAVTSVPRTPSTPSEAATHSHSPSPSITAKPSRAPSPKATGNGSDAAAALAACRARVGAGDNVMAAAEVGMRHWSAHVQAQTDANAGRISAARMNQIFTRTRLAGADDEKRYSLAVAEHKGHQVDCKAPPGTPAKVADPMKRCAERERAQEPALRAAEAGMRDWMRHQDQMRASRAGHSAHPQQTWLRTWRAAPPNIEAYDKAVAEFDAPDC